MTIYASELPDFGDLVRIAAQSKRIAPAIVEKDYFLTRALCSLAGNHKGQFLLKGGTSLSKGWNLLERFSEDIDILIKIEFDGNVISKGERERRMKQMCATLSATTGFEPREVTDPPERSVHRTAEFVYPTHVEDLTGLGKAIKLEMGTRGGAQPATSRSIHSILADFASAQNLTNLAADLTSFEMELLDVKRTFVEKIFAIHGAFMKDRATNKTRHYYGLYQLCQLVEIQAFVGTAEYRDIFVEVGQSSREHFPRSPLPQMGTLGDSEAFNPKGNDLKSLERNYRAESHLFFAEPPPISGILKTLQSIAPSL